MGEKDKMKKNFIYAAALCAACILVSCGGGNKEFVSVKNGKFMLDGKEFRFAGTNNYYLDYSPDKMITDVLDDAQAMNLSVVRCWGFQFGPNRDHNSHGMDTPGEYGVPEKFIKRNKKSPDEFGYPRNVIERLDFTVAEAKKRDIKLVVALNNYWGDFGGVKNASSWQRWFKLEKDTDFFTNEECKAAYKDYIREMLTHTNEYTGIALCDDPTVMAWEVMNEPRNPDDKGGKILVEWTDEISTHIKSLAPKQLCAVGDEGFMNNGFTPIGGEGGTCYDGYEGADFEAFLKLKNIDYGTFHLYPETWGILENYQVAWGEEYIKKHAEAAKAAKKPVVLEEYGTSAGGKLNRLAVYDIWNNVAYKNGVNGSQFWILTSSNIYEQNEGGDGIYDDYDGFRIMNDKSDVSNLLSDYAVLFATGKKSETLSKPRVYLLNPARDQDIKDVFEVRAKFLSGNDSKISVKRAELFIDGEAAPSPRTLNYNAESDTYRIKFDTLGMAKTFPDGSTLAMKVVFSLSDGTVLETAENSVTISNVITYSVIKHYDFATDIADASSMGGYMAEIKGIKHTSLNGGMVQVDGQYSGENDWEELKVKFGTMREVADAAKMDFTFYYEKAKVIPHATKSSESDRLPGVQPYIAFDPGWVKTGLKENNARIVDVPVVTLEDGKEYYKVSTSLEFFQNPSYTFVTICPTLGYIKYEGPIYIDDVILYKKD